MEKNAVYLVYTLIEQNDCVSDCHALYATLERAKAAMNVEIEGAMENFGKGEVLQREQWRISAKAKCCTTLNGCMSSARRTAMGLR